MLKADKKKEEEAKKQGGGSWPKCSTCGRNHDPNGQCFGKDWKPKKQNGKA